MIEKRRLKNVVIFIQTTREIFSFKNYIENKAGRSFPDLFLFSKNA